MKALTVQQPWAWAIIHGGKDVENRTQAWSYRGPLAIHAGQRISDRGLTSPLIELAWERWHRRSDVEIPDPFRWGTGEIIGVVDLVDVHHATPEHVGEDGRRVDFCCESWWAETSYVEHGTGRTRRQLTHLVLANPRPLAVPVPCRGALGLWNLPPEVEEQVA